MKRYLHVKISISVCDSLFVNKHSGNSLKYCFKMSAKSMAINSVLTICRLELNSSTKSDFDVLCELNPLPMLFKSLLTQLTPLLIRLKCFSISLKSKAFVFSICSRIMLIRDREPLFRKIPIVFIEFFLKYFII